MTGDGGTRGEGGRLRRGRLGLALVMAVVVLVPLAVIGTTAGRARVYRLCLHGPDSVRAWAIDRLEAMGPAGVPGLFEALATDPVEPPSGGLVRFDDDDLGDRIFEGVDRRAFEAYVQAIETGPARVRSLAGECLGELLAEDEAEEAGAAGRLSRGERTRTFRALLREARSHDGAGVAGFELQFKEAPEEIVAKHARVADVAVLLPALVDERDALDPSDLGATLLAIVWDAADEATLVAADDRDGQAEGWETSPESARQLLVGLEARIPALVEMLGAEDERLAHASRDILDLLFPASVDAVRGLLEDPRVRHRLEAAVWLAADHDRWGRDGIAREETTHALLSDEDAAGVLAVLMDGVGERELVGSALAVEVVHAIWRLLDRGGSARRLISLVTEAVQRSLDDSDPVTRRAAVAALADAVGIEGDPPRATVDAVFPLVADVDVDVRQLAAFVLSRAGAGVWPRLRELLVAEDARAARTALSALTLSGAPVGAEAIPLIRAGLEHDSWTVREETSKMVLGLDPDVVVEVLPALLERVDDDCRLPSGARIATSVPGVIEQLGPRVIPAVRAAARVANGRLDEILRRLEDGEKAAAETPR